MNHLQIEQMFMMSEALHKFGWRETLTMIVSQPNQMAISLPSMMLGDWIGGWRILKEKGE